MIKTCNLYNDLGEITTYLRRKHGDSRQNFMDKYNPYAEENGYPVMTITIIRLMETHQLNLTKRDDLIKGVLTYLSEVYAPEDIKIVDAEDDFSDFDLDICEDIINFIEYNWRFDPENGKSIENFRKEEGLTVEEMRNRLGGISIRAYQYRKKNGIPDKYTLFEIAEKLGTTPERLIPSCEDEEPTVIVQPVAEDLEVFLDVLKHPDEPNNLDEIINTKYLPVKYKINDDDTAIYSTSIEMEPKGTDEKTEFLVLNVESKIHERKYLSFRNTSNVCGNMPLVLIEIDDIVYAGYYNFDYENDILLLISYNDLNGEKKIFDNTHKIRIIARCLD